jgi:hypothetical protein
MIRGRKLMLLGFPVVIKLPITKKARGKVVNG